MSALRITLNDENRADWLSLINEGYYYASCNLGEANRNFARYAVDANLIITIPHENKAFEYTYFFDIRDTMSEDRRREGTTISSRVAFAINSNLWDGYWTLYNRLYRDLDNIIDEDEKDYEKVEAFKKKLDKLEAAIEALDEASEEMVALAEKNK